MNSHRLGSVWFCSVHFGLVRFFLTRRKRDAVHYAIDTSQTPRGSGWTPSASFSIGRFRKRGEKKSDRRMDWQTDRPIGDDWWIYSFAPVDCFDPACGHKVIYQLSLEFSYLYIRGGSIVEAFPTLVQSRLRRGGLPFLMALRTTCFFYFTFFMFSSYGPNVVGFDRYSLEPTANGTKVRWRSADHFRTLVLTACFVFTPELPRPRQLLIRVTGRWIRRWQLVPPFFARPQITQ